MGFKKIKVFDAQDDKRLKYLDLIYLIESLSL